MAIYAIGDVQGCYDPLQRLLEKLRFDPSQDTLWVAGDLINRGPESLATLRFFQSIEDRLVAVLGNHDLTLLAAAEGFFKPRRKDTFEPILEAADREPLLDWLRRRPLLHHDPGLNTLMVHAGLAPQWDPQQAEACAGEVESVLRGEAYRPFLKNMFGNEPRRWREDLEGFERLRFIVNCLTRMRFCTAEGALSMSEKGPPGSQRKGLLPWFEVPGRRSSGIRILHGHWASLGFSRVPGVCSLDSGCVWGGRLTAVRVDAPEDLPPVSVHCRGMK